MAGAGRKGMPGKVALGQSASGKKRMTTDGEDVRRTIGETTERSAQARKEISLK